MPRSSWALLRRAAMLTPCLSVGHAIGPHDAIAGLTHPCAGQELALA